MARNLKRLGDELDEAEREMLTMMAADRGTYFFSPDSVPFEKYVAIMKRLHDAEIAYGREVTERSRARRGRYRNRKTPPRGGDAFKLRDKKYEAEARIDEIVAARPEFATKREFIDANAAFIEADVIYDYAQAMYNSKEQAAKRRDAADRASNVVRKRYSRKSNEVHL
jgi:hypothetical protein